MNYGSSPLSMNAVNPPKGKDYKNILTADASLSQVLFNVFADSNEKRGHSLVRQPWCQKLLPFRHSYSFFPAGCASRSLWYRFCIAIIITTNSITRFLPHCHTDTCHMSATSFVVVILRHLNLFPAHAHRAHVPTSKLILQRIYKGRPSFNGSFQLIQITCFKSIICSVTTVTVLFLAVINVTLGKLFEIILLIPACSCGLGLDASILF